MEPRAGRYLTALTLGLALAAGAETQVVVYKVRQRPVVSVERSGTSWAAKPVPAAGYLVVEIGTLGAVEAAAFLWTWTDGGDRFYAVADPTAQGLSFLKAGAVTRLLWWHDDRVRALCAGQVPAGTVFLANSYTGFWVDVLEEAYGGTTRVNAAAAAAVSLRLDKTLSTQADVVHDVGAFVQVLVTGLEARGYVAAGSGDP